MHVYYHHPPFVGADHWKFRVHYYCKVKYWNRLSTYKLCEIGNELDASRS